MLGCIPNWLEGTGRQGYGVPSVHVCVYVCLCMRCLEGQGGGERRWVWRGGGNQPRGRMKGGHIVGGGAESQGRLKT